MSTSGLFQNGEKHQATDHRSVEESPNLMIQTLRLWNTCIFIIAAPISRPVPFLHLHLLFRFGCVRLRPFSQSSLQILPLLGRETRSIRLVRMQGLAAMGVCWCIKMMQLIAETKENISQYSWWNCGWVKETKFKTLTGSNWFPSGWYATLDVPVFSL